MHIFIYLVIVRNEGLGLATLGFVFFPETSYQLITVHGNICVAQAFMGQTLKKK